MKEPDKAPDNFRVIEYPFHLGDLIGGTAHLTNSQFGAYMRLILALVNKPDGFTIKQAKAYSRITGRHWESFWAVVGDKFVEEDGKIHHKKVRETVYKIACKSVKNRANALERWNSDDANALPKESKRNTNHQTNKPYKESFSRYDVMMFVKDADLAAIKREFQGWDIQQFIRDFNEWIVKKQERPAHPSKALAGFIRKATEGKTP